MKYIFIIIAIVAIIGGLLYSFNKNKVKVEDLSVDINKAVDQNIVSGLYVDYEENLLIKAEEGKVVLFFHANWCPTCKALENNIKNNLSNIPEDLTILKLDYDKESGLKKKYGVFIQHTLVQVDKDGNEITKWTGGNDLDSILRRLK